MAIYLILPKSILNLSTPYEKLFNNKPNYNKLKCLAACVFPGCNHIIPTILNQNLHRVFF